MLTRDSWVSATNLVWRVVREKRKEILPILSLLSFPPNPLINFPWLEVEEGLLLVGPALLFWSAHVMASDFNYG